ncbi:MAG: thioesterase family protein [Candidatus Nanopelagicales bacterium]
MAAQALVAAGTTVEQPGRVVHSLHAYFLRAGSTTDHIVYMVDRPRDGRSFSTRRARGAVRQDDLHYVRLLRPATVRSESLCEPGPRPALDYAGPRSGRAFAGGHPRSSAANR